MSQIKRLDASASKVSLLSTERDHVNKSWTLRNVDPEVIDLCKHAARQRGQRLGAWVAETLKAAADTKMRPVSDPEIQAELAALRQGISAIAEDVNEVKTNSRIANRLLTSR
jgi:hypothetical protein